jgi:multidrug efflux pump subunit AcrB
MSFGAAAPVEAAVRGGSVAENRDYAVRLQAELQQEPMLRDVQIVQSLEYPTVEVKIDRERAGLAGATADQISRSVLAATSSSRFVVPSYWPDPKSGIGYQVQVEIPQPALKSAADLGGIPVLKNVDGAVLLRDVAELSTGKMPGEFDRYNMKRELSLTANIDGADLGAAAVRVDAAVRRVQQQDDALKDEAERSGVQPKPGRITCELRGQIPPLRQMVSGLGAGLVLAILAIFLMLSANFQSFRLAARCCDDRPRSARRKQPDAVGDRHDAEHSVVYRDHHEFGCVDGERDSADQLCRAASASRRVCVWRWSGCRRKCECRVFLRNVRLWSVRGRF